MTSKFVQNTIRQFCGLLGRQVGVIDEGQICSLNDLPEMKHMLDDIIVSAYETDKLFRLGGYSFFCPTLRPNTGFIYFSEGEDEEAEKNINILNISLGGIKKMHDEKFDKLNFMKNVILDNILAGDLIIKAKDLRIAYDVPRLVYIVKTVNVSDNSVADILSGLFPDRSRDFIVSVDPSSVAIVKEVSSDIKPDEINGTAKSILSTLNSEAMIKAIIGIGTIAPSITYIAKSYKDAAVALEVGKVFDTDKDMVNYDNLGIARLIYHLPTTLCELFLTEIFKKESIDVLDQETIFTIQKFFENNLNVSETSRQLYVHRNTLVYRLDKVQKLTGLDLRIFEHAIVFKVAMMVKRYLVSNPIKI